MKRLHILLSLFLFLCFIPISVSAVGVSVTPGSSFERLDDQGFRARMIFVPNIGFLSADFKWNSLSNAWVFNGEYAMEGTVFPGIELWKDYWSNPTPVNETINVWALGNGLTGVSFVSPNGITYSDFSLDSSMEGFDIYVFEKGDLLVGQTEFTDGEYVFTFTFTTGPPLEKSIYISGSHPLSHDITYPLNGTTGVPTTFNATWSAVGAGLYDFGINDESGNLIYNTLVTNTRETDLIHTIPPGILSPSSKYYINIEALAPEMNGGQKGIRKSVSFTTGN